MLVREINLVNFRNLRNQTIRFTHRVTVVVGNNGQGKTNLLESIYFLSHVKSFRVSAARELINWEAVSRSLDGAEVSAIIDAEAGTKHIACRIAGNRRSVLINEKRVKKASDFFGQLRVIEFTPDDLQLIKDGPAERRQFLDRLLSLIDPLFVEHAVAYERALKHRNALLKEVLKGGLPPDALNGGLATWDELLVRHGVIISQKRFELIASLKNSFRLVYQELANSADEDAELGFKSDYMRGAQPLSREALLEQLREDRTIDSRSGRTNHGSHRDDLLVTIDTGSGMRDARNAASQGQTRSLVLALKLSAVELIKAQTGEEPIVLLDDIESELDVTRRGALYELIRRSKSQVLLTTTEFSPEVRDYLGEHALMRLKSGGIELE